MRWQAAVLRMDDDQLRRSPAERCGVGAEPVHETERERQHRRPGGRAELPARRAVRAQDGRPDSVSRPPLARIEGEFETLLRSLEPAAGLSALVRAMFRNAWDQRTEQTAAVAAGHRKELEGLDAQLDKPMARIVETDSPVVTTAYERKIAALENRKLAVAEQLAGTARPRYAFEDLFERALEFLANPRRIWCSGDFALRRLVLRLAFAERLPYRRGEERSFRTRNSRYRSIS